jgi:hypothetical protein
MGAPRQNENAALRHQTYALNAYDSNSFRLSRQTPRARPGIEALRHTPFEWLRRLASHTSRLRRRLARA